MSSLSFIGDASSYLQIPNAPDFNFGTGDFTIEWYQYQTDTNDYPRIFQVGTYDSVSGISIGVSIEAGEGDYTFIYWNNTTGTAVTSLNSSDYKNKWVHFAICRYNGTTQIFMNGTSIFSMTDNNDFNSDNNLTIGNESSPSDIAAFGGYLADFTWVKGVALYTTDFTVANTYPSLTSDYILLLKASSFDGTLGNTVINRNVSIVPYTPFSSSVTISMKSLFTDNSRVYYKPGSLAACGVGSVRNVSTKSRRI